MMLGSLMLIPHGVLEVAHSEGRDYISAAKVSHGLVIMSYDL